MYIIIITIANIYFCLNFLHSEYVQCVENERRLLQQWNAYINKVIW